MSEKGISLRRLICLKCPNCSIFCLLFDILASALTAFGSALLHSFGSVAASQRGEGPQVTVNKLTDRGQRYKQGG